MDNDTRIALTNALNLIGKIQMTLAPIAALNLPLSAGDVKVIHELSRDAAGPLRVVLSSGN